MPRFKWPSRFLLVLILILALISFFAQKPSIEEELGGIELQYVLIHHRLPALAMGKIVERKVFYWPYTRVCFLMDQDRVVKWSGFGESDSVLLQRVPVEGEEEIEIRDGARCRPTDVLRVDIVFFSRFFRLMET